MGTMISFMLPVSGSDVGQTGLKRHIIPTSYSSDSNHRTRKKMTAPCGKRTRGEVGSAFSYPPPKCIQFCLLPKDAHSAPGQFPKSLLFTIPPLSVSQELKFLELLPPPDSGHGPLPPSALWTLRNRLALQVLLKAPTAVGPLRFSFLPQNGPFGTQACAPQPSQG